MNEVRDDTDSPRITTALWVVLAVVAVLGFFGLDQNAPPPRAA